MARFNIEPDDSTPKKVFVREWMVAVADNDMAFILDCLTNGDTGSTDTTETFRDGKTHLLSHACPLKA